MWKEILHPVFIFWLSQRWQPVVTAGDQEGIKKEQYELNRFLLIPLLRRKLLLPSMSFLLDDRAELRFLGHPYFLRFHVRYANQPLEMTFHNNTISLSVNELVKELSMDHLIPASYEEQNTPYPDFICRKMDLLDGYVELDSSDRLIREYLAHESNQLLKDNGSDSPVLPPYERYSLLDYWYFKGSLDIIRNYWIEMYKEIIGHLRLISLLDTDAIGGGTISSFQGAIFLQYRTNDQLYTVENIIHEASHNRLNQLLEVDSLFLNPQNELFRSPWRKDPRPISGIYHGAYVFTRVAFWYDRLQEVHPYPEIHERLQSVIDDLFDALSTLKQHGRFTEIGASLLEEMLLYYSQISKKNSRLTTFST
ncbi:HEXXH motif-containing putative peptide modification protein [Brevibacillus ruminantium]|uniref:HEXXH motif-containing putative peptide modification protein n=1 Tax=Brevibacillus ruminantium TaxID=2950604 RepID=A0ABY4WDN5_9BACL|nr:HEXXH motif-containing putative peptide modification protein [Brevibacillus ruminantium]USG65277.1 HEXXH motif-containing putative peptide modification protein [Brevibacillus ruminantium]